MAWRDLFSGLIGGRRAKVQDVDIDPFARPVGVNASEPDALALALDEIEVQALEVYVAHGLPDQPGHYRRAPNETQWQFLGEHLTPQARFALTLEHPPEQGWRFARLQDLGTRSDREDLREASRLLADVADLRNAGKRMLTREHLLMALEIGVAWRTARDTRAISVSRLSLTAPKKSRARRDKRSKPA